jgi:hypothetical protein
MTTPPGLLSNTATLIGATIRAPGETTVIHTDRGPVPKVAPPPAPAPAGRNAEAGRPAPVGGRRSAPKTTGNGDVVATSRNTIVAAPAFKLIFLTVVGITLACGAAQVALAAGWEHPTANQQSAFEAIGFAWKAGIGAIFGLLGGKVT